MADSIGERLTALIVDETDMFRLTIRAHAVIDEQLDELLGYAFVTDRPGFLRGPSFQRKVDLCVALGLMSTTFAKLINKLTKLRNEIAHGGDEITAERAKVIYAAAREFQPTLAEVTDVFPKSEDAHDVLVASLVVIWAGLAGCEDAAVARREETIEALETRWAKAAELGGMLFEADLRFARRAGYWPTHDDGDE